MSFDFIANEEKIAQLLAVGTETAQLDYKAECDLSESRTAVELAKDIAAMQLEGGYILIGANDDGSPSGRVNAESFKLLDEATLRKKLEKYLDANFSIATCSREIKSQWYGLISIAPNPDVLFVLQRPGEYEVGGKKKIVFSPGDVFVRHGTSSERWRQTDIARITAKLVASKKEEWRAEHSLELQELLKAQSSKVLAEGPPESLSWSLDEKSFQALVINLVRQKDYIPIDLLVSSSPQSVYRYLESGELSEATNILDRLALMQTLAVTLDKKKLFSKSTLAVTNTYSFLTGQEINRSEGRAKTLLDIVVRVWAVGALAIRFERWRLLQALASAKPGGTEGPSWAGHAIAEAFNAGAMEEQYRRYQAPLIPMANELIRSHPWLNPDTGNEEIITTSLCKFDALVMFLSMVRHEHRFRPNFASYRRFRAEPVLEKLIQDKKVRKLFFSGDDQELAQTLVEFNKLAVQSQRNAISLGWDDRGRYESSSILEFIQRHAPSFV